MAQSFHVWPDIQLNGSALSDEMEALLEQVVVDHHQHLPDMFAITFHDPDRDVLGKLNATIGDTVTIKVTPSGGSPETLIKGEVTGFEAEYGATRLRTGCIAGAAPKRTRTSPIPISPGPWPAAPA